LNSVPVINYFSPRRLTVRGAERVEQWKSFSAALLLLGKIFHRHATPIRSTADATTI
jgi:hypothetical protein